MTYRDLLVHLDDGKACAKRVDAAVALAEQCGAHLTGLYVNVEIPLLHYIRAEIPPAVRAGMTAEVKARTDVALAAFRKAAADRGVAHEARTDDALGTTVSAVVSMHARCTDLVILGQTDPEDPPDFGRHLPEDVALAAGRPVLVVPYIGAAATIARRLLIAWDTSREAARAVGDAIPLLRQADSVRVVSINPRRAPLEHGEVPGSDIGIHLARHARRVEVERLEAGELSVADALLSYIADHDVDLLVMGAYAHARLREVVLGGTTRSILQSMTVPVLMAH